MTGDGALACGAGAGSDARRARAAALKAPVAEVEAQDRAAASEARGRRRGARAAQGARPLRAPATISPSSAVDVKGAKVRRGASLDGADAKALRETLDKLKDKLEERGDRAGAASPTAR